MHVLSRQRSHGWGRRGEGRERREGGKEKGGCEGGREGGRERERGREGVEWRRGDERMGGEGEGERER